MSRNIHVYKQIELASRDTTSPHFFHEMTSSGSREGRSSGPLEKEGGGLQKSSLFRPLGPQFGLKIWGGGTHSPGSATDKDKWAMTSLSLMNSTSNKTE